MYLLGKTFRKVVTKENQMTQYRGNKATLQHKKKGSSVSLVA